MPYKRKSYGRRYPRVSTAAFKLAKAADIADRMENQAQKIKRLQNIMENGAGNQILSNMATNDGTRMTNRMFSGRGSYFSDAMGEIAGAGRALMAGGSSGLRSHVLNRAANSTIWKRNGLFGRGAYETNQLINPVEDRRPITSVHGETGDVIIEHKEYIQDITPTSSGFTTVYSANMNPGLSGTFPWLAQIAQYFEEYEAIQLVYSFKSLVTEGNTSAAGSVTMVSQYNPQNPIITVKQNADNYEGACTGKVTDDIYHGVECDPCKHAGTAAEYIRTGPPPAGTDIKTYDLAVFQLSTNGAAANLTIGELWVHYKFRFSKAKIVLPGANAYLPMLGASIVTNAALPSATNADSGKNFLNIPVGVVTPMNNSLGTFSGGNDVTNACTLVQNSGSITFAFPTWVNQGDYRFTLKLSCAGGAIANYTPTVTVNYGSVLSYDYPILAAGVSPGVGGNFSYYTYTIIVRVNSPSSTTCTINLAQAGTIWTISSLFANIEVDQVRVNQSPWA